MKLRSSAKVLIHDNSTGKYLILRSSEWEENSARSHQPDLPGGLVEEGETALEGLEREISEEIGMTLSNAPELAYAFTYKSTEHSTTFLLYITDVETTPDITLSWEHEAFSWMSADELRTMKVREPYPTIFAYLDTLGVLS